MKEIAEGEYIIKEGCTARLVNGRLSVYPRKCNRLKANEYRCKDCKHRREGYSIGFYKTMICEEKPKGKRIDDETLYFSASAYGKICEKFELYRKE